MEWRSVCSVSESCSSVAGAREHKFGRSVRQGLVLQEVLLAGRKPQQAGMNYGWHGTKPCWWNLPWSRGFRHATWWNERGVWGGVREKEYPELSSTEKNEFSRLCRTAAIRIDYPSYKKCKNYFLEEDYIQSFQLCQEPWMYLHVNIECSLESFFIFLTWGLFYYQEGGWIFSTIRSCLQFFFLCCAFFFPLSFSNPACQIPVCVKGEGVLEKTMKVLHMQGTLEKAQGFARPTPFHPCHSRRATQHWWVRSLLWGGNKTKPERVI